MSRNASDSKATPPLLPEIRLRPATGLSIVIVSAALGVLSVRLAAPLTVMGASPVYVMVAPSTVIVPLPGVVALGVSTTTVVLLPTTVSASPGGPL